MIEIRIKTEEIHWNDLGIYALNLSTMQFENCSGFGEEENCVLKHWVENTDEVDISNEIRQKMYNGVEIIFCLYDDLHQLCGYVYVKK